MCFKDVVIAYSKCGHARIDPFVKCDAKLQMENNPQYAASLWDLVPGFIASINPLAKSCIKKGGSTILDAYCEYCSPEIVAERTRIKAARANGTLYSAESLAAANAFEAGRKAAEYDRLKEIWVMQENNAPYSIPTAEETAADEAKVAAGRPQAIASMTWWERLNAKEAKAKVKKLEHAKKMGWEIIDRW